MRQLAFVLLFGCTPQAPATPSFQEDVLPILAANCVRCHGFPVIGGAPRQFRLDSFEDVTVTDGAPAAGCGGDPSDPSTALVICGAASYAAAIPPRIRDEARPMPPRFPLDDYQIETLENWAQTAGRGTPRPNNELPEVAIEAIDQTGTIVTVRARVVDPDGDLVAGTLIATIAGTERVIGPLRSGHVELRWDVTGVPAGNHSLAARVDDGAANHPVSLGTITVGAP